jgi:transposase
VLEPLAAAGKTAVIPPRNNRSSPRSYDRELYAARHLIENFFAKDQAVSCHRHSL